MNKVICTWKKVIYIYIYIYILYIYIYNIYRYIDIDIDIDIGGETERERKTWLKWGIDGKWLINIKIKTNLQI